MGDIFDQLASQWTGTVFEDYDPTKDQTSNVADGGGWGTTIDVHERVNTDGIAKDSAGEAMAAFVKAGGWHNLGTVVTEPVSTRRLMEIGGVDYEVFKTQAVIIDPNSGEKILKPNTWDTWRRDRLTKKIIPLGTVSGAYPVFQNADCFEGFGDAILAETTALAATCGALYDGRQAFCCWRLPKDIRVADSDISELWMMARTSHDKSTPFDVCISPLRVVCANTGRAALRQAVSRWSIRHTRHAAVAVQDARESLKLSYAYAEEFEKLANQLVMEPVSTDQFAAIIEANFAPKQDASKATQAKWSERRGQWMQVWETHPTLEGVRNTAWAATQTIGFWADWMQGARPKDAEARRFFSLNPDGYRFVRSISDDKSMQVKQRIFEVMAERVGVTI